MLKVLVIYQLPPNVMAAVQKLQHSTCLALREYNTIQLGLCNVMIDHVTVEPRPSLHIMLYCLFHCVTNHTLYASSFHHVDGVSGIQAPLMF